MRILSNVYMSNTVCVCNQNTAPQYKELHRENKPMSVNKDKNLSFLFCSFKTQINDSKLNHVVPSIFID